MHLNREEWLRLAGLHERDIPDLVILEGTWWDRKSYEKRLAYLENVRESQFPNMYLGSYHNQTILFCSAYGAPRAVEPVHIFGSMGTRTVIQIGSCGGLQNSIQTGDIVLPEKARIGEGASQYYGHTDVSYPDPHLVSRAAELAEQRGIRTHRGLHLTTSALLAQPPELIKAWHDAGYLAVDMETSAVFSAATFFDMKSVSLLFVWDELLRGRTWLDSFSCEEVSSQERASLATFEIALSLA